MVQPTAADPFAVSVASRAPTLPREEQVSYVLKLLTQKGETAAEQVRQRIGSGSGVVAKGLFFPASVLSEALDQWLEWKAQGSTARTPQQTYFAEDNLPSVSAGGSPDGATSSQSSPPGRRIKRKSSVASPEIHSGKATVSGQCSEEAVSGRAAGAKVPRHSEPDEQSLNGNQCQSARRASPLRIHRSTPPTSSKASATSVRASRLSQYLEGVSQTSAPGITSASSLGSSLRQRLAARAVSVPEAVVADRSQGLNVPQRKESSSVNEAMSSHEVPEASAAANEVMSSQDSLASVPSPPRVISPAAPATSSAAKASISISAPKDKAPGKVSSLRDRLSRRAKSCGEDTARASVATPCTSPRSCLPRVDLASQSAEPGRGTEGPRSSLPRVDLASQSAEPCRGTEGPRASSSSERLASPSVRDILGRAPRTANQTPAQTSADQVSRPRKRANTSVDEPAPAAPAPERNVRELKALLTQHGLDSSSCVEKADLEALLARFELFHKRPLAELRASCAANGGPHLGTAIECARFLAQPDLPGKVEHGPAGIGSTGGATASTSSTAAAAAAVAEHSMEHSRSGEAQRSSDAALREQDASREVHRILPLQRLRFPSPIAWGLAVLGVTSRDVAAVQRAYRALMKKLHPDKVGGSPEAAKAVEMVREAKEVCERSLSRQEAPGPPRMLRSELLCSSPGRRRIRLHWAAPEEREAAPVRRYIVAVVDPAYGKALTITVLEPDYSEELQRFVSVEEITSYVLEEGELQKMPRLWEQAAISAHVAAANEAGQSPWAVHQVPLTGTPAPAATAAARNRACSAGNSSAGGPKDDGCQDVRSFEQQVRSRRGADLRGWLEKQKKVSLAAWLRSVRWPGQGTKEELVERAVYVIEGNPMGMG